jgi:hypothetical protein
MKIIIPTLVIMAVLGVFASVFMFKAIAQQRAQSELAREERAVLQAQVASQRELTKSLQLKLDSLDEHFHSRIANANTNATLPVLESTLRQLISELVEQRSVLAQAVGGDAGMRLIETPEQRKERVSAGLEVLESRASDIAERERAEFQKLDRLRVDLNVPEEVATLDPEKAMLQPKYSAYREFFNQVWVCEETRRLSTILRMKIATERIDTVLPRSK